MRELERERERRHGSAVPVSGSKVPLEVSDAHYTFRRSKRAMLKDN